MAKVFFNLLVEVFLLALKLISPKIRIDQISQIVHGKTEAIRLRLVKTDT